MAQPLASTITWCAHSFTECMFRTVRPRHQLTLLLVAHGFCSPCYILAASVLVGCGQSNLCVKLTQMGREPRSEEEEGRDHHCGWGTQYPKQRMSGNSRCTDHREVVYMYPIHPTNIMYPIYSDSLR